MSHTQKADNGGYRVHIALHSQNDPQDASDSETIC